jgi:hypothetical protein
MSQTTVLRLKQAEEPLRSEKLEVRAYEYADRQISGSAPKTFWATLKEWLSGK